MNQSEAARDQWWDGLSDLERAVWTAKARSAGVQGWELKKASIFDRGVTFEEILSQLDQEDAVEASARLAVDTAMRK